MRPPEPANEEIRLRALRACGILDTPPDQAFDEITRLGKAIFGVAVCAVSLVDADRQWFKAIDGLDVEQTPRDQSFCAYAILNPDSVLVVEDATTDARMQDNPLVTGFPYIRFYAGAPISTTTGEPIGALCIIDPSPRTLSEAQIDSLRMLANQVGKLIELNMMADRAARRSAQLELEILEAAERESVLIATLNSQDDSVALLGLDGSALWINPCGAAMLGRDHGLDGARLHWEAWWGEDREFARAAIDQAANGLRSRFTARTRDLRGEVHTYEVQVCPIRGESDEITRLLAIARDISARVNAEASQRRSQMDLERVIENLPAMVAYWDRNLRNRIHNRTFREFIDKSRREIMRSTLPELIGEEAFARSEKYVKRALRGKRVSFTDHLTNAKGERRLLRVEYVPDVIDGEVVGILALRHDVTELHELTDRLRLAQSVAKIGSWEFDIARGAVTWSENMYRLLHLPPDQSPPNYEGQLALYAPTDQIRLDHAVRRCIEHGESYDLYLRRNPTSGHDEVYRAIGCALMEPDGRVTRLAGTLCDVTAEQCDERDLKRRQAMIEAISEAIVITDEDGVITYRNPAARKMLECGEDGGTNLLEILHSADGSVDLDSILPELATYRSWAGRLNPRRHGAAQTFEVVGYAIEDPHFEDRLAVGWTLRDVTARISIEQSAWLESAGLAISNHHLAHQVEVVQEQAIALDAQKAALLELNRKLQQMADTDALTGLHNRRYVASVMRRGIATIGVSCSQVAVVLFDIDCFKAINDHQGHAAGDQVLRAVARLASSLLDSSAVIARWGGEEFLIFLTDHDADSAARVGEMIRQAVAEFSPGKAAVTISVGVSATRDASTTIEQLVDAADQAMYASKQAGRNRTTQAA